jgi:flagellar hook-associated protein 3 FlgL
MAERLLQSLQRGNRLLVQLQDQAATGQKFFLPSDAPAAAIRTILLQRTIERKTQMQANIQTDRSMLSATEASFETVSDAPVQAKSLLLSGVGNAVSPSEKQAMAVQLTSLVQGVINAGNARFRGRYLFGGSQTQRLPFELLAGGVVRYNGDAVGIQSFVDFERMLANNMDGASAFSALTKVSGGDLDPALSLDTKLADLRGGLGVKLGPIKVTVNDGVNPAVTATVDLSGAETVRDIKTRLENAIGSGPPTLTVDIDPATLHGLRLTPSGGTVAVSDIAGSKVASELGIAGGPTAQILGADLDPRLTLATKIADLRDGAGIGTSGNGLKIVNGPKSATVDISAAVTLEDLFNTLRMADIDVDGGINDAGNGVVIFSRLAGANFSIGEDGGTQAADLGVRTLTGATLLSEFNLGRGVPLHNLDENGNLLPALLEITRRDGTSVSADLKGLQTVQQVLGAINAVDPGELVASLNAVGNGISIVDNDGVSTGPLVVHENIVSVALGMNGTEPGTNPAVALAGKDVNPRQSTGVLSLLVQAATALNNGDDAELSRLDALFGREIERFNLVRGDIGGRLKTLDEIEGRLLDEDVSLQESLSLEFDSDLTEVVTQISRVTTALQATMQIASVSYQLSLLNFL